MAKVLKPKLLSYTSLDQCGKWNTDVCDAIKGDANFIRLAETAHESALRTVFDELPVDDGIYISGADIEIGSMLAIRFNMSFLSPTYFYAPAEFVLRLDSRGDSHGTAIYRCGVKGRDGEFKLDRKHCVFPTDPANWAVSFTTRLADAG